MTIAAARRRKSRIETTKWKLIESTHRIRSSGVICSPRSAAAVRSTMDSCESSTPLLAPVVPDEKRIDDLGKFIVYRIVQEALNNAVKYSGAAEVRVSVRSSGGRLAFSVSDDGKGFDPAATAQDSWRHYGLKTMRERAESVGGSLHIWSEPGGGTRVVVRMGHNGKEE